MGHICSKPSTHTGAHTVLSPAAAPQTVSGRPSTQRPPRSAPQPTVTHSPASRPTRNAAAEAAEKRLKAEKKRGVKASSAKGGSLAAKLDASRSAAYRTPEARQEDRLVVRAWSLLREMARLTISAVHPSGTNPNKPIATCLATGAVITDMVETYPGSGWFLHAA
ncbi:hypothetical protein EVG20_g2627 [Dentipellis fragilis]|uniref:Uncharacterized protein n=1 Tax=Dentipellis fragilis TaxID=205917 RepID=A0A4Y9Z7E3_9AGAM|nr:hypothetical protein EVG20_g2627 [Dentipellis fragilis]